MKAIIDFVSGVQKLLLKFHQWMLKNPKPEGLYKGLISLNASFFGLLNTRFIKPLWSNIYSVIFSLDPAIAALVFTVSVGIILAPIFFLRSAYEQIKNRKLKWPLKYLMVLSWIPILFFNQIYGLLLQLFNLLKKHYAKTNSITN